MDNNEIKELLKTRLDEKRFSHSLCVADEAVRLAKIYGANEDEAYFSGLVHDITKNASDDEHLKLFHSFDIILSDIELHKNKLWHAISGSVYVKNILNIDNEDIINAVRYHTTARANMSKLEKVVYLADFTSADRTYGDVDIMRRLVEVSMEDAMTYSLSYIIGELIKSRSPIHPDTLAAYNEVILKQERS